MTRAITQDISLELNPPLEPTRVVGLAFGAVLLAHLAVDMLGSLVPSTLGLIEARLQLTAKQSAWLLGSGPLFSGLAQPICALVSDRLGTRVLGWVGLLLGLVGIGSLGLADSFASSAIIYALGVIGIGMFHPVGAATIGHLWHTRRTSAVSYFFVAGMVGGVLGSLLWPRLLATTGGFRLLPLVVVPGLLLVVLLQRCFSGLEPLHVRGSAVLMPSMQRTAWLQVGFLYIGAVLRFCVNMALIYLFVRWVQSHVGALHTDWEIGAIAKASAPRVGNLNAAMMVGMGIGGMFSGVLVRPGKEKWPLVLVPVLFAPVIALFPFLPLGAGYVLATAAGIGFAAMIPVTIALAQHLMPHRTNLASSLMMGGGWAVAMFGPTLAEYGVAHFGLQTTFLATAATLVLAGLVCLPLSEQAA